MQDEDLSQWDVLVVMSGDGLLHEVSTCCHSMARAGGKMGGGAGTKPCWKPEGRPQPLLGALWGHWGLCAAPRTTSTPSFLLQVLNGLMERPDWEQALQTPLCILPGGSGNALAASINYYAG